MTESLAVEQVVADDLDIRCAWGDLTSFMADNRLMTTAEAEVWLLAMVQFPSKDPKYDEMHNPQRYVEEANFRLDYLGNGKYGEFEYVADADEIRWVPSVEHAVEVVDDSQYNLFDLEARLAFQ